MGFMGARSIFTAIAAVSAAVLVPAHASPWNRRDGALYVSTLANYYSSNTDVSRYSRFDNETYVEYGATPRWMIGGRVSYGTSISASGEETVAASGLNEAEIYLQRQIQRGAHSATSFKISGVRSGSLSRDAQLGPPAPNMEVEFRALHGRDIQLNPFKIFAAGEIAYRRRFGGDADQFRADALIGIEPASRLLLLIEQQSIVSLRNEAPGLADFDIYKGQASIVWRKSPRLAVVIGARKDLAARNIAPGAAVFAGLWSEF